MHPHPDLTVRRVEAFAENELRPLVRPDRVRLDAQTWRAPDRVPFSEAARAAFRPVAEGERLGPDWSTWWFRLDFRVPPGWTGRPVDLLWDCAGEGCLYSEDGEPLRGFARPSDPFRLLETARGGERFRLYVETACNGLFGVEPKGYPYSGACLAVFDPEAWNLYWDLRVLRDIAADGTRFAVRAARALDAANRMVNVFRPADRETWKAAAGIAREVLGEGNGAGRHEISAIGHAHIDTAWLWPMAETRRKCVRTFATALHLMERYPEYRFVLPQAQQADWIRRFHPGLFRRIRERARQGRFLPVGGSWVEPDCNLPSGESLLRQLLFGQRFFEREFGRRCRVFWNPDVFGCPAALPQILRHAGIEYFLTQKLSWNQFNTFPHSTFEWEGHDGSRILTHFPPADTYNGTVSVRELGRTVERFKEHGRLSDSCLPFGYGDGGGGPTEDMLERARRLADVADLPRVTIRDPEAFFDRCRAGLRDAPVWVGELYLERHRGTYTTQAAVKRANRLGERALRDAEWLCACAHLQGAAAYPGESLAALWETLLVNQFHDILPGSSIGEVYSDHARDAARLLAEADRLFDAASGALCGGEPPGGLAFNSLGFDRIEILDDPETGDPLRVFAPAFGWAPRVSAGGAVEPVAARTGAGCFFLENARLRAELGADGRLRSLVHKPSGREAVDSSRAANRLVLFDDRPVDFDAWDVDVFHLEKRDDLPPAESVEWVETGPLRARLRYRYRFGEASVLEQTVELTAGGRRLDFVTLVEWRESHRFLKVEFPAAVRTDRAAFEIQHGFVRRPTHRNTSWDMARFEVPAHRWADVSEHGFGVALLNDSKYGYGVEGNVLRLSLLRAPRHPDPGADRGEQRFTYSLYPHVGGPASGGVIEEALRLNHPLRPGPGRAAGPVRSFSVDGAGILLDTVKKAEDSDAIALRAYEARGGRGTARFRFPRPPARAWHGNALEDRLEEIPVRDGAVEAEFAPFQLRTLLAEFDVSGTGRAGT